MHPVRQEDGHGERRHGQVEPESERRYDEQGDRVGVELAVGDSAEDEEASGDNGRRDDT